MTKYEDVRECGNCGHAIVKVERRDTSWWTHIDISIDGSAKDRRDCFGYQAPQAKPKAGG